MRGVYSARWPNSNPPGRVAQGGRGLLIPVISSEFGVEGGGVEKKMEMGQARRGVVDETCCESG